MAHEVSATMFTKVVSHKDLEIEVKTIKGEKQTKLGKLLISKGNIQWLPKGASVNMRQFTWAQFAKLMGDGKQVKAKKVRAKKSAKAEA